MPGLTTAPRAPCAGAGRQLTTGRHNFLWSFAPHIELFLGLRAKKALRG
jgi:hypothetical protein